MWKLVLGSMDTQQCVNCWKNDWFCDWICSQEEVKKQSFGEKYNLKWRWKIIVISQKTRDYLDLLDIQAESARKSWDFHAKHDKGLIN